MILSELFEAQIKPYAHEKKELDELVDLIERHCSDALDGERIFRGSKSSLQSGIFNPASGGRTSANTSNYYTTLLDTNAKNAKWPKRSESFIATTHQKTAKNYGSRTVNATVLVLFPFNGTPIGVVNEPDMWDRTLGFSSVFSEMPYINEMNGNWKIILHELGVDVTPETPTMDKMLEILNNADPHTLCRALMEVEMIPQDTDSERFAKIAKQFIKEVPLVYSYIDLGCDVVKPGKLVNDHSEVWFSGKCVGVTLADYEKIKQDLEQL